MSYKNEYQDLELTSHMARHFSEDIKFIRKTISNEDLRSQDLRRMSSVLRRLIIDGDLVKIAGPRVGKIKIKSPQLNNVHKFSNSNEIRLYSGGVLEFKNISFADIVVSSKRIPRDFNIDQYVELSVDQFCSQRVVNLFGEWVNRRDIVKYVANIDGGVHSDPNKYYEKSNKILSELKGYIGVEVRDGYATVITNQHINLDPPVPWGNQKGIIDFSLIQLMSTAQYLERSPQVVRLEEIIDSN